MVLAARSGLLKQRIGSPAPARTSFFALAPPHRPHHRSSTTTTKLFSSSSASLSPRLLSLLDQEASDPLTLPYDAIMVLGGGIETSDGALPPWVLSRLDFAAALQRESSGFSQSPSSPLSSIVLLGAGTPHKPPPPDGDTGRALTEAKAAARYLLSLGENEDKENENERRRRTLSSLSSSSSPPPPASSILKEEASFDTVGNALFGLTTHALPAGWTRIAVVTSSFHMPRARAIFSKTFALASEAFRSSRRNSCSSSSSSASAAAPGGVGDDQNSHLLPPFELSFLATRDQDDLQEDVREARAVREAASTAVREEREEVFVFSDEKKTRKNISPFFFFSLQQQKTLFFQRWISDTRDITSLQQLHTWVHAEHLCYSTAKQELFGSFAAANKGIDPKALASY